MFNTKVTRSLVTFYNIYVSMPTHQVFDLILMIKKVKLYWILLHILENQLLGGLLKIPKAFRYHTEGIPMAHRIKGIIFF